MGLKYKWKCIVVVLSLLNEPLSVDLFPEKNDQETLPEWEQELQRELQEYELVNEADDIDDADLENEIMKQIEEESATS